MTLQELYRFLMEKNKSGALTLDLKTEEASLSRIPLLCGCGRICLEACAIALYPEWLEAKGSLSLPDLWDGKPGAANLRCTQDGTSIQCDLTLSYSGKSTFLEFFGELPSSRVTEDAFYELTDSVMNGLILHNPILTVRAEDYFQPLPFSLQAGISFPKENWNQYDALLLGASSVTGKVSLQGNEKFSLRVPLLSSVTGPLGLGALTLELESELPDPMALTPCGSVSAAMLSYECTPESMSTPVRVASPLFQSEKTWMFYSEFQEGLGLSDIINLLASLAGLSNGRDALLIPPGLPIDLLKLYQLQMSFTQTEKGFHFRVDTFQALLHNGSVWKLPIPGLTLESISLAPQITWGAPAGKAKRDMLYTVDAVGALRLDLGNGFSLLFRMSAQLPSLELDASLAVENETALSELMVPFGASCPKNWGEHTIAMLNLHASPKARFYSFEGMAEGLLSFELFHLPIRLENLLVSGFVSPGNSGFSIGGTIGFGSGRDAFSLQMLASYESKTGLWQFAGGLRSGTVNIGKILTTLFGLEKGSILEEVLNIELTALRVEFDSEGRQFKLTAAARSRWELKLFGTTLEIAAKLEMRREASRDTLFAAAMFGLRLGAFEVVAQLNDFYAETRSYLFRVKFQDLYLQAAYSKGKDGETLSLSLGGMTLGSMVESLVNLVNPNARFALSAPWSLLHKIDLSRFSLVIQKTGHTTSAAFLYHAGLDIAGLMRLEDIGARYEDDGVHPGRVKLVLTGRLLEKEYTIGDPIAWDVLDEAPPPAAKGEKKFHLYYLGMGQHASCPGVEQADSIPKALESLRSSLAPVYHADTGWLFAADFKVNDLVRVSAVFNDPALYGILITVDSKPGSALAAFQGLSLELLYKKISDEIGMFRATLRLPDRFRRLQLGAVTIEIGVLRLEVYTNGNFLIDLGFPANLDFSQSFLFHFGPYIGRGGLYFGILNGVTCADLPKITNGSFATVTTIGVGLSVGMGRSFDFGIVKGGVSLEVFGIFEGTFAIFRPLDKKQPEALYYRAKATVGITGRLYLSVDLKIIAIQASVEIKAYASLTLESYKPTLLDLDLSLKVSASIKILFIKIHFSFSFHQHVQFIIGEESPAPWTLQQSRTGFLTHRKAVFRSHRTPFEPAPLPGAPYRFSIAIQPLFSLENPVLSGNAAPQKAAQFCVSFLATMEASGFHRLIRMLTEWLLSTWEGDALTPEGADSLQPEDIDALDYPRLHAFLNANAFFSFDLPWNKTDETAPYEGAAFPLPPPLALLWEKELPAQLKRKMRSAPLRQTPAPAQYDRQISRYFQELNPDPYCDPADLDLQSYSSSLQEPASPLEMLFLDDFHMILKELLHGIQEQFKECTVPLEDLTALYKETGVPAEDILIQNPELVLRPGTLLFSSFPYQIAAGDTLAFLSQGYSVEMDQLLAANESNGALLCQGTPIRLDAYRFQNRRRMPLLHAAALFYVRIHEYEIASGWQKHTDPILAQNSGRLPELSLTWECTVQPENEIRLHLPGGIDWPVMRGDTVVRLAKYAAVLSWLPGSHPDWDSFLLDVLRCNQGEKASVPNEILLPPLETSIDGDQTLDMLFRRLFPDQSSGAFEGNPLLNGLALPPLVRLQIPKAKIPFTQEYTVQELARALNLGIQEFAGPLVWDPDRIKPGQTVTIARIQKRSKQKIVDTIATEEYSARVSSMTSRFLLQGLRVPDPQDPAFLRTIPLYQATGQQVLLADPSVDWRLTVSHHCDDCQWLETGQKSAVLTKEQIQKELPQNPIPTKLSPLTQLPAYGWLPKCYPASGLISCQKSTGIGAFSIQLLPEELQSDLPDLPSPPSMVISSKPQASFHWGILLSFAIRRVSNTVCEVFGVEPGDRPRLHSLIEKETDSLNLLYQPSPVQGIPTQLVALDLEEAQSVFVKTNLSPETHRTFLKAGYRTAKAERIHADFTPQDRKDLLTLLWHCSVTSAGGYALLLKEKQGQGLPSTLFDEDGWARLWLLVQFKEYQDGGCLQNCTVCDPLPGDAPAVTFYPEEGQGRRVLQPNFPAGSVGLTLTMEAPDEESMDLTSRTERLFSILGYRVLGDKVHYTSSKDSAPLVPCDGGANGLWRFTPIIPLYRFAREGDSIYSAVGKTADIQLELRDVLGNRADAGKITITPDYNDLLLGLSDWPCSRFFYRMTGGPAHPVLRLYGISQPADNDSQQESLSRMERIRLQINQCPIEWNASFSLNRTRWAFPQNGLKHMKAYVDQMCGYLSGSCKLPRPFSIAFPFVLGELPDTLIALSFTVTSTRRGTTVEEANKAAAMIPPYAKETTGGAASLDYFAQKMERALPLLHLASGDDKGALYGVSFGNTGYLKQIEVTPYSVEGIKMPEYYALRPLKNEPISRKTFLRGLNTDATLSPPESAVEKSFVDVDLEAWANHFLEDLERVLAPEAACQAALSCPQALDGLAACKRRLANAIANQLTPLRRGAPAASSVVQQAILSRLLHSLSAGYQTGVAAQYRLVMASPEHCRITAAARENEGTALVVKKLVSNETSACVFADVQQPDKARLPLHTSLALQELEYEIHADGGYESSRWLRFLHPIRENGLLPVRLDLSSDLPVPAPRKSCPQIPRLLSHKAASADAETAAGLLRWRYELRFTCTATEQDTLVCTIQFRQNKLLRAAYNGRDLFGALAQYEFIRDGLMRHLEDGGGAFSSAFQTFSEMASAITGGWEAWTNPFRPFKAMANPAGELYYTCEINLDFSRADPFVITASAESAALLERWGAKPPKIELVNKQEDGSMELLFFIDSLPLLLCQGAAPSLHMIRNQNLLITEDGQKSFPVDEAFIYQTGIVKLPELSASIYCSKEIVLQSETPPSQGKTCFTRAAALLCDALELNAAQVQLKICAWYGYGLTQGQSEPFVWIPSVFFPGLELFSKNDRAKLEDTLASALFSWYTEIQPSQNHAALRFEISISSVDGQKQLIHFNQIQIVLGSASGEDVRR